MAKRNSGKTKTTVTTHYFDPHTPLLENVTATLLAMGPLADRDAGKELPLFDQPGNDASSVLDLSWFDVVLPSSRASRRLQEKLASKAQQQDKSLVPPDFISVGALPSRLVRLPNQAALDFEQSLAWSSVFAESSEEQLKTLIPVPPRADAKSAWLELGSLAKRLVVSLSRENLTFADVLSVAESDRERQRWTFLTECLEKYLIVLDRADRCDPNIEALKAINQRQCRATRPIILVGTSDLSELVKQMLRQVQSPITCLIATANDHEHRFDALGCLIDTEWNEQEIPLRDDQLITATTLPDQAHAVMEQLAVFGKSYSTDQITIGVTDESQVNAIEHECQLLGVPTYRHLGHRLADTSIGRLMDLITEHLQRRTWRSLAALVRHADVYRMIDAQLGKESNWLIMLDRLLAEALPRNLDGELPEKRVESRLAQQLRETVEDWLKPIDAKPRTVANWSPVVLQILEQAVSSDVDKLSSDVDKLANHADDALLVSSKLLERFSSLSESLDGPVDGTIAFEILSTRIAELNVAEEASPEQVEILGWLDLALDDAPALVVCGLNHPFVPEAVSSDPFLPSTLRSSLSQRANNRRYARDLHAMTQMLARSEQTRIIVGSHAADGSPTPPSRLLAAATPDDAARRVCRILTETRPSVDITLTASRKPVPQAEAKTYFLPPPPEPGRTINTLSVTAFSAYLTCPYRFYLRHVLNLRPVDDASLELAANQFGDLVHGALEWFGESPDKDEDDPDKIANALVEQLHRYAKQYFGDNTQATVQLQIRQAQKRLQVVAQRQAERVAQGWRIHAVEASVDEKDTAEDGTPKKPTGIILDGQFTGLRGRFDRIDHHPQTGRWAILDYKTHGETPEKKHLKSKPGGIVDWVDLQLPLYRRFIPDLGIPVDSSEVDLGYFNVAEKESDTRINLASFSEQEFERADELIEEVIRNVRDCRFEPTSDRVQYDDYEMMFNEVATRKPASATQEAVR